MVKRHKKDITDEDIFSLKLGAMWRYFRGESFAFWMVCGYLFMEYVRPQSIYPMLDFLPWTKLFVIGAILGSFTDKSVKWVSSPINKLLIAFLIVIFISSYLAYYPSISYQNLSKYYLWVIIYFVIINIINTKRRFFIFICIFLVSSFKLSLSLAINWASRGFAFTSWGLMGPPGFFQNSGELAIQMLVFWPIAWAFIEFVKPYISKRMRYSLYLMPITAIMVILGASSRGGQLALVCQLVVMNYRYIFRPKILLSLTLSMILIWTFLPDAQKARFQSAGEDQTSVQRILYWERGLDMIKEHPYFGIGYFNFAPYFEKYYPEDMLYRQAQLPHNIFIQVGTDAGITGLLIFILLIFSSYKKSREIDKLKCTRTNQRIGNLLNLSLLGFLIAGQFVTVTYYPFLWINLAFVVLCFNIQSCSVKSERTESYKKIKKDTRR